MKSEHRHELETNWLAHHVAAWLERIQPYNSLLVSVLLTVAVLLVAYSFFGSESSARQSAAWNSYNEAVAGAMPNLEKLRDSAAEFPDSAMQPIADITWADGNVWLAARYILLNRTAANEALNNASSTYQSLLSSANDERIKNRAHFGLGRVYELQNDLDKAREEYLAVKGVFEPIAAERAKLLAQNETKSISAWLATAEAPRVAPPTGPGTPGERPQFRPGELELPPEATSPEQPGQTDSNVSVDDLFKGIGETDSKGDTSAADRYKSGDEKTDAAPADGGEAKDKQ